MSDFDVTIEPSGQTFKVDADTDILNLLRDHDIYIKSSCGGHASCSDCIVKVLEGKENINDPSFEEKKLLGNVFHITKERMACQMKVTGPVKIDISAHDRSADPNRLRNKGARR